MKHRTSSETCVIFYEAIANRHEPVANYDFLKEDLQNTVTLNNFTSNHEFMRIKTPPTIALILTLLFANGIDLYSQNNKEQLLDAITAQGLWVQMNPHENNRIERLCLAESKVFGIEKLLSFDNIFANSDFASFLQSSHGLAVISEVPKGVKFENNLYAIDEWVANFEFDQTQSIENRPVLIFKFSRSSIAELVNNKNMISELTTSSNLETVKVYMEKVKKKLISEEQYAYINKILNDPNWIGILGINLSVDCRSLPAELQIVAASIGRKHLPLDHLGMTLLPYNKKRGLMSAFGLIDYEFIQGNKQSDDLKTPYFLLQLLVGFENSSIKAYKSNIALKQDFATSFWSKQGKAFSTYELENQLDKDPNLYTINGSYQLSGSLSYYSFIGEDRLRPVSPLLRSLKLNGSQKK